MKQWMKYMAVACGFLVMAIVCFPNKGNRVSAEGTTSGNTVQMEEEGVMPATDGEEGTEPESYSSVTSWIATVQYVIGDGAEWRVDETFETEKEYIFETENPNVDSGARFEVMIPDVKPEKKGYTFKNWKLINSANEIIIEECTPGEKYDFSYTQYAGKTLTFTAVWTDSYEDVVNIVYENGDGTALEGEGYRESIIQKMNEGEYETSFTVTVTSNTPNKDGNTFFGWEDAEGKTHTAGDTVTYNWADYSSGDSSKPQEIKFIALWKQETTPDEGENEGDGTESGFLAEGATPTNGENKLEANIKYILGSGTWTVNGTPTIYEGGSEFYVEVDGTYTFSQCQ